MVPLPNPPPDRAPRAHGMRRVLQSPRTGGTCWALEPGPPQAWVTTSSLARLAFCLCLPVTRLFPHRVRVFLPVSSQCWFTDHWSPTMLRPVLYQLCPFAPVCSRSLGHLCPGCVCLANKWEADSRIWDYPLSHPKMNPLKFQGMDCDLYGLFQSAPSSTEVMSC